jgi:hypothetical protein
MSHGTDNAGAGSARPGSILRKRSVLRIAWLSAKAIAVAAASLLIVGLAGCAAHAADPTARVAPAILSSARQVTSRDPLRVLVLGDGVAYDLQPALVAALASGARAQVTPGALFGFGLTRSDVYDWRRLWTAAVARTRPDLVIVFLGPWDIRTVTVKGTTLSPGQTQWAAWYRDQATAAARLLTSGGAGLIWVGATLEPGSTARIAALNDVLRRVTVEAGGRFIDGARVLAGPDGRYRRRAGGTPLFKVDDEHLCQEGATRLATAVAAAVSDSWRLAVRAGWPAGGWRSDARYQGPGPTGCPPG